jgi:hypothetical protein
VQKSIITVVVMLFAMSWTDPASAKRVDLVPPQISGLKMQADGWRNCMAWCNARYSLEKEQLACHLKCDRHWGPH